MQDKRGVGGTVVAEQRKLQGQLQRGLNERVRHLQVQKRRSVHGRVAQRQGRGQGNPLSITLSNQGALRV